MNTIKYVDPNNKLLLGDVLSRLAFVYALNGNYRESWNYQIKAEKIITEISDERMYHYNLINLLLLGKCSNTQMPIVQITEDINAYIQRRGNDKDLQYILDFVQNLECSTY